MVYYAPYAAKLEHEPTAMSANAVLAPTQTTFRAANLLRLLLIVAVVLTPTAVTFGLANILNITPIDAAPTISDEILYWHQVATFREVGFNGGYYTINEVPAPAEFSHFFTKGPLFPAIYGTLGRLLGWAPSAALGFNLIFVTIGLMIFVIVTKPTTTQLLVALPLVATFWPLMLNIPLVMQEAFQCAVAIALAGLFYIAIKQGPNLSRKRRWLFVLIIVASSLVKGITLAVLLVPLLLVTTRKRSLMQTVIALAQAGALIIVSYMTFRLVSLPESRIMSGLSEDMAGGAGSMLAGLWTDTRENIEMFAQGRSLEIVLRFQVLFIAIISGIGVLRGMWPGRGKARLAPTDTRFAESLFHLCNLGAILAANVIFYDVQIWRDYRVMLPHLLLSALVMLAFRRWWLVTLLIVVHLLLWPKFRETYAERHLPPESDINFDITTFEDTMNQYVHYDAGESNSWCNTMLMSSFHQIQQRVIGVPAGIGLSSFRALDRLEYPIKSRYVLMDHTRVDTTGYPLNLEVLAETDIGTLYLNRDADCD